MKKGMVILLGGVIVAGWSGLARGEDRYMLQHRLTPGETLQVTVDLQEVLQEVPREIMGISAHRIAGWTGLPYDKEGAYQLSEAYEEAIRDLRLPMTRFYAVGVEEFGVEGAIDRAADLARIWNIPEEHVVLELEVQGAKTKLPPETWAAAVRYAVEKGYGFRRWEISNEPWNRPAFPNIETYRDHVIAVSQAIREVQPEALIGMAMWRAVRYGIWDHHVLLEGAAGHYDWVAPHYYDFLKAYENSFEDLVLAANYKTLYGVLGNQKLLDTYNPDRRITQYDTEWTHHTPGPSGGGLNNRQGNIYGTLHCAVRMIYYAREALMEGAGAWELFTPDNRVMGFISSTDPDRRTMRYWLYYYFTRHLGDEALAIEGTAPWHTAMQPGGGTYKGTREFQGPATPVLVTRDKTGRHVYVIVANGYWDRPVEAEFAIPGFDGKVVSAWTLSHDDPDASPYVMSKDEVMRPLDIALDHDKLQWTAPPRSVGFIKLEARSEKE